MSVGIRIMKTIREVIEIDLQLHSNNKWSAIANGYEMGIGDTKAEAIAIMFRNTDLIKQQTDENKS